MLTVDNFEDTVYVISEDSDEENSLMLKITLFHKEDDLHMKSISTKSVTTIKETEKSSFFYERNMVCNS